MHRTGTPTNRLHYDSNKFLRNSSPGSLRRPTVSSAPTPNAVQYELPRCTTVTSIILYFTTFVKQNRTNRYYFTRNNKKDLTFASKYSIIGV